MVGRGWKMLEVFNLGSSEPKYIYPNLNWGPGGGTFIAHNSPNLRIRGRISGMDFLNECMCKLEFGVPLTD